jgi:dTDP-4-dehydrorhamnose reductase
MKPAVLITGGSGLLALNWALAVRDRFAITLGIHARRIELQGVAARIVDLESVDALRAVFESVQPMAVIHAAGMTNVDACEADPPLAHHVNVELAVNVANACARSGTALAHISTDHLFSGTDRYVSEDAAVSPVNVYGRTKAEAEARVLDTHPQALVARTNFYGWGTSYRRSFSDVIVQALRSGQSMTLFEDVHYTPILATELARTVHELLKCNARGIFNVVGDERLSKRQFGLKIAERLRLDPAPLQGGSIADNPALVRRPREMSLSNRKAADLLGRTLGRVDEHLEMLLRQQQSREVREVQAL